MGAGLAYACGTGGLGAIAGGGIVFAHGLDQYMTGMRSIFSNNEQDSATISLLKTAGLSDYFADICDGALSTVGTDFANLSLKGAGALASSGQLASKNVISNEMTRRSIDRSSSFFGSRRFQLDYAHYQKIRNPSEMIMGRKYQGHALDRMQDRGFVPSVIENAVKVGRKSANKVPGRLEYYDPINRLKVVTEANGEIVTIIPGRG